MTKAEYIIYYRKERSNRPNVYADHATMLRAIKELYCNILLPHQEAFCRLVDRYRNRVSQKHMEIYYQYKEEGAVRAKDFMEAIVYSKNPFMDVLPKREGFHGDSLIIYKVKSDT